jgi:hypothetical protein
MISISRRAVCATICALAALAVHAPQAGGQNRVAVPPELEGWRDWALHGEEHRRCTFVSSMPATERGAYRCAWPESLELRVDARGGTFTQRWQVFAEEWIALPGDLERWPRDIRIDGAPGAIVLRDGVPMARLGPGAHSLSGRFEWGSRPESLRIPTQTGIVALTVDGQRVAQPERPDGAIWLGKRRAAAQPEALEVQVYRLVEDQIPVRLATLVRLQVAGESREALLARTLPEGFTPLSITSELPARLEPDGRLRVQVRPGSWEVLVAARGPNVATALARPKSNGPWPREEIWSFAGDDRLRVAVAEGAEGIDPAQATVPPGWRGLPAFRMGPDTELRIVERSRGLANADDNRLRLARDLWLDFDHGGFTAVDRIGGTMRREWRLDMVAPFRLESVRSGDATLLVTRGVQEGSTGVEIRAPSLELTGVARTEEARGASPATGWLSRFENVQGRLHLPPGHRLLGVWGADSAPGSWWSRWGLWNLFGVFVVVVFTGWVAGRNAAILALAALVLTYQESPEYIWLWANLIAAIGLARMAPEGRFRRVANGYRAASFVLLGVALLPLLYGQLRLAIHPQLDAGALPMIGVVGEADMVQPMRAPEAPATVPAPASELEIKSMEAVADAAAGKFEASGRGAAVGLNYEQRVQRYAPGTLLQTGPGIPDWRYNTYGFGWSGPVEPGESVRFFYIGPFVLGLWRVTGVVLLAAFFLWLLREAFSREGAARNGSASASARGAATGAASVVFSGFVGLTMLIASPPIRAESTPDPTLLGQLRERLLAPPKCQPSCAEILAARVVVTPERLSVTLEASALARLAIAIPHASDRWQIEELSVDGRPSLAVGREGDGSLWVPLEAGAHTIRLAGRLAQVDSVQLAFPQSPRAISVEASGWDVSGVAEGRLLAASLELARRRAAGGASAGAASAGAVGSASFDSGAEFPPFVRVVRNFQLDLDWNIVTTVERVAPERAALNVAVPLVPGESVLTEGIEVRERRVLVGLEPGQASMQWTSGLPRSETIELSLPERVARTEQWSFIVNPQWHVEFEGFPAVLPEGVDAGAWVYQFPARPGETLRVRITRPEPAEGRTLAIDSVTHRIVIGKRSSDAALELAYRSTQGGRHTIRLPEDARVTAVRMDGAPVQIRPEKGALSLSLLPGSHRIGVDWMSASGASLRSRPEAVDLGSPASNVRTTLELPADRWALAAFGPGVGPAILYWGELVVFLATAWLLGRWAFSPLRTHEWLLLGLGLSTLSWGVLAIFGGWLFAMRWRERWAGNVIAWRFNLVQAALAVFGVIAISTLVWSGIKDGLLSSPNMGVVGPGSDGNTFRWFLDQTQGALPQPAVFNVPLWVYKALMFAWAIRIAFALRRWLVWAGRAWFSNGFWRGKVIAPATSQ